MSYYPKEFGHLPQNSEMVTMLQNTDWSSTPLGHPSTWPELLRLQLNICFESAFPIAIWWGPDLIQFYNDGYKPILGALKHPKAFGGPAHDTWPDIWPTIGPMVEQVVNRGVAVKGEDMPLILERNGFPELCHFTFSYSPIRNIDGHIDGMFTAAVETTERVSTEKKLQDSLQRQTEFLSTLAHELRNPLAPIRSGLTVLSIKGDSVDTVAKVRGMMERQVSHMVTLIDDLLDVARITGDKLVLKKTRSDIRLALSNALEISLPLIEEEKHVLHLDLPHSAVFADIDVTRITQVVGNLLNNSAKYTPSGGRIELALREDDYDAFITVADNGIGIPAEEISSLFELFSQIRDGFDRSQGGLGIGLSLVRSIVEMHNGKVFAISPGASKGATFTIRLPKAGYQDEALSLVSERQPENLHNVNGVKLDIMVVDDNIDAATTLSMLLELRGHNVRIAHDGIEALEQIKTFGPKLVLLDIGMPRLDGYETARRLRCIKGLEDACLVAVTGWGTDENRAQAEAAGFNFHLTKPVHTSDIEQILLKVTN